VDCRESLELSIGFDSTVTSFSKTAAQVIGPAILMGLAMRGSLSEILKMKKQDEGRPKGLQQGE
jgi:hypothetical protein